MPRYTLAVRAIACAASAAVLWLCLTAPVFAGTKFQANIVPPPTTYDANNNLAPGLNYTAIPGQNGSPDVTGLYQCVGPTGFSADPECEDACPGDCFVSTCTMPGPVCNYSCAGARCKPATCNANNTVPCTSDGDCNAIIPGDTCANLGACGPNAVCAPAAAPDGVTASDTPVTGNTIDGQKSSCLMKGTKVIIKAAFTNPAVSTPLGDKSGAGQCQGGSGALCSKVNKCSRGTCKVGGAPCTLDADCALTCATGKEKGQLCGTPGSPVETDCPCGKDADCGKDLSGMKGACVDGNEYIASVMGVMQVAPATSCLSGGCVIAMSPSGLCLAGTCSGATIRPGQICQVNADCPDICTGGVCLEHGGACTSVADCGTGFCNGPGSTVTMPTRGAVFALGLGPLAPLCPFSFRFDFPMEVNAGKGKVVVDLSKTWGEEILAGSSTDSLGCEIREPGTTQATSFGLFKGTPASTLSWFGGRPAPNLIQPMSSATAGTPLNEGIGAIIGVSGMQQ